MDCAFSAAEHAMAEEQSLRILDSSGMARAKQETLIAHVSFQHLQEPGVSVFRGSDTGYVAAGSRSGANEDEEDASSSEDEENEGTPNEDANEQGHSNNPLGTDIVQQEDPFRKILLPSSVDEDSDATKANTEAETDPANLTARKEQDIYGMSEAPKCGPSTATAKQTPAANQACLETQVEETFETPTRLEAQVEETLEMPRDETHCETQVEERPETPEDETQLEAQVEETLETPTEDPLAMPIEESLEAPAEVALDHSQELLLSDVADCSDLPVAYSTEGGLPYTLYYVDINPTDRDE